MLCGVTATLGSNPSATATAARPHWGRAVLLCLGDVLCGCVAVLPHGCFGRRRARPPARLGGLTSFGAAPRSPPVPSGPSGALHTSGAGSLMCGFARRLEARPSPATARGCRSRALRSLWRPSHQWGVVAVNSSARPRHRPRAPQPGPPVPPVPRSGPATARGCRSRALRSLRRPPHRRRLGVLHYMKPSGGVSSACRTLM